MGEPYNEKVDVFRWVAGVAGFWLGRGVVGPRRAVGRLITMHVAAEQEYLFFSLKVC